MLFRHLEGTLSWSNTLHKKHRKHNISNTEGRWSEIFKECSYSFHPTTRPETCNHSQEICVADRFLVSVCIWARGERSLSGQHSQQGGCYQGARGQRSGAHLVHHRTHRPRREPQSGSELEAEVQMTQRVRTREGDKEMLRPEARGTALTWAPQCPNDSKTVD